MAPGFPRVTAKEYSQKGNLILKGYKRRMQLTSYIPTLLSFCSIEADQLVQATLYKHINTKGC